MAVPDGVGAGDLITIALDNGDQVEVEVPEGLQAGDIFEVSVGPAYTEQEAAEAFETVSAGRRVLLSQQEWEVVRVLEDDAEATVVEMQLLNGDGAVQQFPLEQVSAALKRTLQWDTSSVPAAGAEPEPVAEPSEPPASPSQPELPEGWTSGRLGNGTEFWFRIDNPSDVSWTFPSS